MNLSILTHGRHLRRALLSNSAFLIANTLAGSFFGFLFWIIVARVYTPAQVGIGAAYIAAITFLTNAGEMGLGTAWIRFLPGLRRERNSFVNSSLVAAAASTLIVTALFVAGIPIWSPVLGELLRSDGRLELFMLATLAFGLAQLLDRLYIAFQVTQLMFARNLAAHILRIALVVLGAAYGPLGLLLAVGGSSLITLMFSACVLAPRALPGYRPRPAFAWAALRSTASYTLGNHFSLLLWNAPPLIYPLVIVALLGAAANAHFYTSWMIANLLFVVPTAIATSAIARAANQADRDDRLFWQSLRQTMLGLIPIAGGLLLSVRLVLRMFGAEYAVAGGELFIYLVVSIFPYTVNTFVIAYHRIHQHTRRVIQISALVTAACLGLSVAGGTVYGLAGVGMGWLGGQALGALVALASPRLAPAIRS
jgi:O-antigen/teichoic acid export membrane protein